MENEEERKERCEMVSERCCLRVDIISNLYFLVICVSLCVHDPVPLESQELCFRWQNRKNEKRRKERKDERGEKKKGIDLTRNCEMSV